MLTNRQLARYLFIRVINKVLHKPAIALGYTIGTFKGFWEAYVESTSQQKDIIRVMFLLALAFVIAIFCFIAYLITAILN